MTRSFAGLLLLFLFLPGSLGALDPDPAGSDARSPEGETRLEDLLGPSEPPTEIFDARARALRHARRNLPGKETSIVVGERLLFSVRYGIIRAGEATMEVVGIVNVGEHPCYHVVSKAWSNGFFDKVYRVRDRVQSWMDVNFLYSRRFEKSLREGGYRKEQRIEMDQENRLARYQNGVVYEFAAGAHDILSAFYYVRSLPLEPGQEFWLESHADRKNYPLRVAVHGRETIEVPAGEFQCLVVEPMLRSPGLFRHEGKLVIWLTDDERKMPVQMRSKIPIGSITVVLTDFVRPG